MYLKRLELSGFKSFAKKTILELDSPITAIVGPNGSGKSNVAEAVRFVLGEQSMKSLRGKSGTDLIFKGSKAHGALGRGAVSIIFDNRKRVFAKREGEETGINVDFDEIIISREVYGDGANSYLVNGSQVRLKDIMEILAPLNIGSSGHHIISQGEADKILNSSIKDRKEMIEDALGLRVYQYKIIESERKLEKTNENIKEAESLRRELAPHIAFLKKQMEKIEKAREMREELKRLYFEYFKREDAYLKAVGNKLENEGAVRKELNQLDSEIAALKRELSLSPENEASNKKRSESEDSLQSARNKKDELSRKLGRLEGMIELEEERAGEKEHSSGNLGLSMVTIYEVEAVAKEITDLADRALLEGNISFFQKTILEIKEVIKGFLKRKREFDNKAVHNKIAEKLKGLKEEREKIQKELDVCLREEERLALEIEKIKELQEGAKENLRDKERSFFELSSKRSELSSRVGIIALKEEKLRSEEEDFRREFEEAVVLVGEEIKGYRDFVLTPDTPLLLEEERVPQEDRRKKIERIKIRLEDAGIGQTEEIENEYRATSTRDKFLETEITDLKGSKTSLEGLIAELKEKLDIEFKNGVSKINKEFTEFFHGMFGGGTASLSVARREKKHYRSDIDEEERELFDKEEKEIEEGIEINVSLPQKRIKDLTMLSGGERALTSIALLFAITQVNPPPFLVLDETDAALDEANSRKYGEMLGTLSKLSHLIVITHNRETMSHASVLYGITMGADGTSRILSVKFDEAVEYAK